MSLDTVLPIHDATVARHIIVKATPEKAYEAILTTDLTESGPVVTVLNALRFLPGWVRAVLREEPPPRWDEELTLEALPTYGTWVRLIDEPPREFVFGAVGRVWKPDIEW
ncbi:MAG: hypothetical protein R3324_09190, partial [Halobacteriales archaeon]|nr:hypothetical protein [Halobacteriales archaeon]